MVKENNQSKPEWKKNVEDNQPTYWAFMENNTMYMDASHKNSPSKQHLIPKIFLSMTEKEQHEVYRQLNEKIHSVNGIINNISGKIQKDLQLQISHIEAVIIGILKNTLTDSETFKIRDKTDKLISKTSFWFPRKYREAIVGDLMEDCHELRTLGKSEWRIRIHVVWQVVIALILLRPAAMMDAFKRIWSVK